MPASRTVEFNGARCDLVGDPLIPIIHHPANQLPTALGAAFFHTGVIHRPEGLPPDSRRYQGAVTLVLSCRLQFLRNGAFSQYEEPNGW